MNTIFKIVLAILWFAVPGSVVLGGLYLVVRKQEWFKFTINYVKELYYEKANLLSLQWKGMQPNHRCIVKCRRGSGNH